jgi:hypothetical protein
VTAKKVLLLTFCIAGFTAPAQAQTLARAEVRATVRIPDFMSLRIGETTAIASHARRVTVYVTANRAWQLSVANACESCTVRIEGGQGRNGNDIPVTIEYEWPEATAAPDPAEIQYVLVPG